MKSVRADASCDATAGQSTAKLWTYKFSIIPVLVLVAFATSCALIGFSKGPSDPPITISVSPATPTISSNTTQQFTATVSNTTNTSVTWSVDSGTISATGLFTAPTVSSTTYVTVTATSQADSSKKGGATAIVTPPPSNVSIQISPVVVELVSGGKQQFTAAVQNTTNTGVSWAASAGTIDTKGLYTAPNVTSTLGVTVVATSQADATKQSSAAVHVNPNTTVTVTTSSLPQATGGAAYSTTLSATGGQTPYKWSFSGSLPVGIQLNASTGSLSGTTSGWGSFAFTAKVTDAASNTDSKQFTLVVTTPSSGPAVIPSTLFSLQSKAEGGTYPTVSFGSYRLWDLDVDWNTLNPASGSYDFTNIDGILAQLKTHGMNSGAIYTFGDVPAWASSNPTDVSCNQVVGGCDLPADLNADGTGTNATFIAFAQNLAQHVNDPTYLQTHARVKYWEPWNEWYRDPVLSSTNQGCIAKQSCTVYATYAQMVRMTEDLRCVIAGTGSVNGVPCTRTPIDSSAKIITPASQGRDSFGPAVMENFLHCDKSPYATSLCTTGDRGRNAIDVINFHFYAMLSETAEEITFHKKNIVAGVRSADLAALPLFSSEGGWGMDTVLTDPDMQEAFVPRYYLLGWTIGASRFTWYEFENNNWGTLYSPQTNGSLTQAGHAYQQVYNWMTGNEMTQPCTGPAYPNVGVWTCGLSKPDGTHLLAVWDSSQSCTGGVCSTSLYTPNSIYKTYVTLENATPVTIQGNLPIGAKPILLVQ